MPLLDAERIPVCLEAVRRYLRRSRHSAACSAECLMGVFRCIGQYSRREYEYGSVVFILMVEFEYREKSLS